MRVETKHQQTVVTGALSNRSSFVVGHVQEQVLPMLQADRVAAYLRQTGDPDRPLTTRQVRQLRKTQKRALARGIQAVA